MPVSRSISRRPAAPDLNQLNWGGIALGAMAGLCGGLIVYLLLAVFGVVGPNRNAIILILIQFLSLVIAGYVAGRFTSPSPVLNGGLAGLGLFLVIAAISLAAAARLNPFELGFLGILAAVLGSAGGALAEWRRHES